MNEYPLKQFQKWYRVALFNLVVLAILGLLLRYKINFSLPVFQQANLLHAHSHFAFNGWIGFLLQVLILDRFTNDFRQTPRFWNWFFTTSTIVNYGMIATFIYTGYSTISIAVTTVALLLSYIFVYKIWKALPRIEKPKVSSKFVKAALFFLVLSSLGPYALAILIATNNTHQYWAHNALYFFLHFQYNGWFTFSVLAFLMKKLEQSPLFNVKQARLFFILLAATCIPSYLFTSLWHQRPFGITVIIVITATLQTAALYFLWRLLNKNTKTVFVSLPAICRWLYSLAICAFILKISLQFFSVHPQIAQLAFGYRPIIIGYLHLIFLAFISMYLLGLLTDLKIINLGYGTASFGLVVFATGIIINEILLAIQGAAAIGSVYLPNVNLWLFGNTFALLTGAILLFLASVRKVEDIDTKKLGFPAK